MLCPLTGISLTGEESLYYSWMARKLSHFALYNRKEERMKKKRELVLLAAVLVLFLGFIFTPRARANDVPRVTKEELKEEMGEPDLVIIDVRTEADWKDSKLKIKGAVREDPKKVESWMNKYSKEKILVFYCS
jgi:predicted sulfurtransferase